jgi:hypothetical protein
MHDCQNTNERLLDLAANELAGPDKFALLAELQHCDGCRDEYHSVKETLRAFDAAHRAVAPPALYWEGYQSKLRQQLRALEVAPEPAPAASWWRRWLTASIPVPVPFAAAAALLVAFGGAWAMRVASRPSGLPVVINAPAAPVAAQPKPEVVYLKEKVEVPAPPQIIERVVTRTVYVNAPPTARANNAPAPRLTRNPRTMPSATDTNALAGFQPPSKVELQVIKGDTQEK